MYTLLDEVSVMLLSTREVDVKPFGPVQLHVPPLCGCGPRFTVAPEFTVALLDCCQAPPFTCRYGTIGVGLMVMVKAWVLLTPSVLV